MKKLLTHFGFCFALLAASQIQAQTHTQAQSPQRIRAMEGVTEYRLDNGLQVLLAPNDLQPRTYVNLVVKAGSAVEGFGEGGMAHLLEHLVFKGTPTTRDPMKSFADRSLSFNGTTNKDRTNYFAGMNPDKENLHWYLGWLADASMSSFIAKADLDKEMTVVRNEFERAGSSPDRAVYESRMALAFPNHGYGRPTIGIKSDIENVNIERLQAFYKTWYRPDNMALVVTGRFDETSTLVHIQSVFGVLKNPAVALPTIYSRETVQDGVREAVIRRVGSEVGLMLGWRGAPRLHRDDAVLDVVASSLVHAGGGRFKSEVENRSWGTQVQAWHGAMLQYGAFDVSLRLQDAKLVDQVQAALLTHIQNIAAQGVTAEELKRAQSAAQRAHEESKRSAESLGSTLAEGVAGGDWRLPFWYMENIQSVTQADTQRAVKAYLIDANRVRVMFVPDNKPVRAEDPVAQALGNYTAKPSRSLDAAQFPPLARFEPTIAEIEKRAVHTKLNNGARLVLLARPAVGDTIVGSLRLHWGNLQSMRGQGVTPYFGGLLLKGTTTRSESQIKDELDALQSKLSVNSGTDGMTVSFTTTRAHWRAFAALMHDVLRRPAFKEADFKVWQQEAVANATKLLDSPEAKANNALQRAMSSIDDKDDPRYQPTLEESVSRWQALTLESVQRYWSKFSGATVAELGVAGALDVEAVQQDMAAMLDDWQPRAGGVVYQRIPRPVNPHIAQNLSISTPDKPNALLYAAYSFSGDPWSREGIAMSVASGIIGGGSNSRLYTKVRKEEGLSYGVWSYLSPNDDDQVMVFGWGGIFAPSNKAKFENAVQEVFADVTKKGLSSIELFVAKRVAADRIKQQLASDGYIAGELARAQYKAKAGQPRDAAWYEEKQQLLQSLTIEEVDAAARKLVDFSRLVRVTAGDFK